MPKYYQTITPMDYEALADTATARAPYRFEYQTAFNFYAAYGTASENLTLHSTKQKKSEQRAKKTFNRKKHYMAMKHAFVGYVKNFNQDGSFNSSLSPVEEKKLYLDYLEHRADVPPDESQLIENPLQENDTAPHGNVDHYKNQFFSLSPLAKITNLTGFNHSSLEAEISQIKQNTMLELQSGELVNEPSKEKMEEAQGLQLNPSQLSHQLIRPTSAEFAELHNATQSCLNRSSAYIVQKQYIKALEKLYMAYYIYAELAGMLKHQDSNLYEKNLLFIAQQIVNTVETISAVTCNRISAQSTDKCNSKVDLFCSDFEYINPADYKDTNSFKADVKAHNQVTKEQHLYAINTFPQHAQQLNAFSTKNKYNQLKSTPPLVAGNILAVHNKVAARAFMLLNYEQRKEYFNKARVSLDYNLEKQPLSLYKHGLFQQKHKRKAQVVTINELTTAKEDPLNDTLKKTAKRKKRN